MAPVVLLLGDDVASARCPYLCIYSMKHLHEKSFAFSFLYFELMATKTESSHTLYANIGYVSSFSSSRISMSRRKTLRTYSLMSLIFGIFPCMLVLILLLPFDGMYEERGFFLFCEAHGNCTRSQLAYTRCQT